MTIGEKIKYLRTQNGLTQKTLAEKAGLATGTIQQYELGKRQPRIEQLENIACILNTTLNELVSDNLEEITIGRFWEGIEKNDVIDIIDNKNTIWKEAGFSPKNPPQTDADRDRITEVIVKNRLLEAFQKLNISGKHAAASQIELLTEIPRYTDKAPTD